MMVKPTGVVDGPAVKYETKDGIKLTCKVFDQRNWKDGVAVFSEGEAVGGPGLGGSHQGSVWDVGSCLLDCKWRCRVGSRMWKSGSSQERSGLAICIWESSARKWVSTQCLAQSKPPVTSGHRGAVSTGQGRKEIILRKGLEEMGEALSCTSEGGFRSQSDWEGLGHQVRVSAPLRTCSKEQRPLSELVSQARPGPEP